MWSKIGRILNQENDTSRAQWKEPHYSMDIQTTTKNVEMQLKLLQMKLIYL